MFGRFLRRALALAAVSGLLHGCALGNVGALAAHVTRAESAVVVDVYGLGALLRTRADDSGMTLGVGRRSYVFAETDARSVAAGWHLLVVPLPDAEAVAQHRTTLGLEVGAGPVDYGVTLGLRVSTVIARLPPDADIVLALDYTPAHPERTRLYRCRGFETCALDPFFQD